MTFEEQSRQFTLWLLRRVEFTYEVVWTPTDIEYENRFDRYLEDEYVACFTLRAFGCPLPHLLSRCTGSLSIKSIGFRSSTRL